MAIKRCLWSTPFSKEYAKKHNMKEAIVLQKMDSWQLVNNRNNIPTEEELNSFIENQKEQISVSPAMAPAFEDAIKSNEIVKISHKGEDYLVTRNGTIIQQKNYSILNLSKGDGLYDALQEQAIEYFGNKDLNAINQRDLRSNNMDNIFSKALQESISTGNWTEEALNELDTLTNKKENGQLLFKRFPQEVGAGITGILAKAETLVSGSSQGTGIQNFRDRLEQFQVKQSEGKEQEQTVESWAKEEGIWFNDYTDNKANLYPSLEAMLSSEYEESYGGSESYVYQDKEHQEVVKAISLLHCDDNVQIALDRMVLHNQLFPNTAYALIGFGRDSLGHFRIIAKQKFVQGESASSEEIKNFAEKLGLREEQGWWFSQDGLFKITDLSPLNVLKDVNGELQILDCDIELVPQTAQQLESAQTKTTPVLQIASKKWTRGEAAKDTKTLYIFTDNSNRDSGSTLIDENSWYAKKYGKNHHYSTATSAVLRGLNNARPITTQRYYKKGVPVSDNRWTDKEAGEFEKMVSSEIDEIIKEWNTGKYDKIELPMGGLFNSSISMISKEL